MTPIWPGPFGIALLDCEKTPIKQLPLPRLPTMTCKPESKKQRLERIAVQLIAGAVSESELVRYPQDIERVMATAITAAKALIKQLDALPLDE